MEDIKFMRRCLQLAKNGLGTTYPNPLVGSVIVYEGKIIGEGWHQKAGEPHAEVNAINAVKDKSLLSKSTIYVSLEPCSHFGKTPPCSDLIVYHKIPRVVVGTIDPHEKVAGKGIEKLRKSGAEVKVGVLEKECIDINRRFFTFHHQKRPYIILKWAESADGFLAPLTKSEKKPVWITNVFSRQLVHKWRTEEQSILVGTNTVLEDNPKLNSRDWRGNQPVRIVIDKSGKISNEFEVKNKQQPTLIITEDENHVNFENCMHEKLIFDTHLFEKIVQLLFEKAIQSVIIEGGSKTLLGFIDANIWDEVRIFKSEILFHKGVLAPKISYLSVKKWNILNDELLIGKKND